MYNIETLDLLRGGGVQKKAPDITHSLYPLLPHLVYSLKAAVYDMGTGGSELINVNLCFRFMIGHHFVQTLGRNAQMPPL